MQMITDAVGRCRQVLEDLVKKGANTEMSPESLRCAIGTIKDAVNELGRQALEGVIANAESAEDVLEREGRSHRFKQVTAKNWLTPFGRSSWTLSRTRTEIRSTVPSRISTTCAGTRPCTRFLTST